MLKIFLTSVTKLFKYNKKKLFANLDETIIRNLIFFNQKIKRIYPKKCKNYLLFSFWFIILQSQVFKNEYFFPKNIYLQLDFYFKDDSIPDSVREFEKGFEDGVGEKGNGVHLTGEEKERGDKLEKIWAFNKVRHLVLLSRQCNIHKRNFYSF